MYVCMYVCIYVYIAAVHRYERCNTEIKISKRKNVTLMNVALMSHSYLFSLLYLFMSTYIHNYVDR